MGTEVWELKQHGNYSVFESDNSNAVDGVEEMMKFVHKAG